MPDTTGIRTHLQQGVFTLACGDEAFARLAEAVAAAAGPGAAPPAGVSVIVLNRELPPARPTPCLDALGYLGCGLVAAAVITLLGAGAYTVSGWFW